MAVWCVLSLPVCPVLPVLPVLPACPPWMACLFADIGIATLPSAAINGMPVCVCVWWKTNTFIARVCVCVYSTIHRSFILHTPNAVCVIVLVLNFAFQAPTVFPGLSYRVETELGYKVAKQLYHFRHLSFSSPLMRSMWVRVFCCSLTLDEWYVHRTVANRSARKFNENHNGLYRLHFGPLFLSFHHYLQRNW